MIEWLNEHPLVASLAGLTILGFVAWGALVVVRRYVLRILSVLVKRTPTVWDEVLLDRDVFHRAAWAVPVLIVYHGIQLVPGISDAWTEFIRRFALALLVLVVVRTFAAMLAAANTIYNRYPVSKERPIKGYLQVVSVAAHILAVLAVIALLMNRDVMMLLGGLGAMTAVLLLIFRDTLLSLVAGIQLTSNKLIQVGDWIEMPQFNADGDVVDIALNTVTVQNWDKTLTVIPTHKFLENSFKNWRGMQQSGGRRIKRAIYIDMGTIRFLTDEEIERFGRFVLLRDYIQRKRAELAEYNAKHVTDPSVIANARRLTNIGTLRAYIIAYLRNHPMVRKDMTFLVRQLHPTPEGLPLEIYVFAADTAWANYEGIQADIFDHILAIVPEFGLSIYQKPSGRDLQAAIGALRESLQPA